nr:RNA-directed DNA polymerase, eukaryota [Tanacetum cinerariifolium]
MVPDTIFSPIQEEPKHDNKSNFEEGEIQSEDPFHIYDLLVKEPKNDNKEEESSKATSKYPPGFTSDNVLRTKDVQDVDDVVELQENTQKSNKQDNFTKDNNVRGVTHSKEEDKESFCSGQFRRSVGGILCAWDLRMFHKHNATISDYFVVIQGEWIANAKKYLVISVYAPQEASKKRMLWSYLNHMIDRWGGESILMGNFNEVQHKEERFGSVFNNHNEMVFNSFISSSGLGEVPLGGCAFTWCHKSGSKMSKLDRFLFRKTRLWVRDKKESATTNKAQLKGNWIEDPNSVKNEFFSHFKERFDSPCSSRLMLEEEFINKLSADQSIDLEGNVTIEEIKRVVWDCGIDKSPGPDGFTFGFYRRYWDIIKKDVADAVTFFFISGNFPKCGNSCFIALILKMQDAKVVKDYRPISLIGSLYKIIAKILANRLVGVFGEFIRAVYDNSEGIETHSRVSYSSIWLSIVNEVNKMRNKGIDLLKYMKIHVGNNLNTKFWEDVWMGNKNFKTSFLRIYALESNKNQTVADKMAHNDTAFLLRRQPRVGVEMEQFRALSIVIEGVLLHDMVDRWKLTLEGSG